MILESGDGVRISSDTHRRKEVIGHHFRHRHSHSVRSYHQSPSIVANRVIPAALGLNGLHYTGKAVDIPGPYREDSAPMSHVDDVTTEAFLTPHLSFINESWWNFNISDNSTGPPPHVPYRYWVLFLLIFPLLTVFGNCLVVLSVWREKGLKNVTNYFIVSLAFADLLVAIMVMPPAVYVEFVTDWGLAPWLCDAWIASDVLGSTASILNLTAISVDRFIAVTHPIKYAKHKNGKRFVVMLALAWVTSLAIAAPVALGVNYSKHRIPTVCILYNADFIIYSSMGSFFIPSVIMLILYGKILLVLRNRAKRFAAKQRLKTVDSGTIQSVIENATQTATITTHHPVDTHRHGNNVDVTAMSGMLLTPVIIEEPSISNIPTTSDTPDDDDNVKPTTSDNLNAHVIPNVTATQRLDDSGIGYSAPLTIEIETQFCQREEEPDGVDTPEPTFLPNAKKKFAGLSRNGSAKKERTKKTITKFNFNLRQSKRKKESRASAKREKKATKTLAIVLGVFLVCWVPFFTINITSAICMRYELKDSAAVCDLAPVWFSTFVWLGYINSFLNPVIYTIFNPEFRKAFQKLLTDPCMKTRR